MKTVRLAALAIVFLLAALRAGAEPQQRTLLTADGTLYDIRSGLASDLSVTWPGVDANDYVVVWHAHGQDGSETSSGVIPTTPNQNPKTSLALTFDETSGSLVVLWREENPVLNKIRLAIFKAGGWTVVDLLPNPGFPHAYNPRMLLTHQTVRTQDEEGQELFTRRSILSVIWWEESSAAQARYVPIFLDEEIRASDVAIYDLPELVADPGATPYDGLPRGAYAFPTLQSEGPGGGVIASFATLASKRHMVVRIGFPNDLGTPGPGNITWLRRRIPVVGVSSQGPIAMAGPLFSTSGVRTVIGDSYLPTLHWREGERVAYVRYNGIEWSAVKAITLSEQMSYERAVALVEEMALRN